MLRRTGLRAAMVAAIIGGLVLPLTPVPAGAAEPSCWGRLATHVGTEGDDVIEGTPSADVIYTGGGNDRVNGDGGHDIICTGSGNDIVHSGDGNDRVDSGPGTDQVWTADGADRVTTGDGNDAVDAGPGNDRLWGQGGDDRLIGGAGDDVIKAGGGDDRVRGGPGDDRLFGGPGQDRLRAGGGDDRVSGGSEADLLVGSGGDDWLGGGDGRDSIRGGNHDDILLGSAGADQLLGGDRADQLLGGKGRDYLDGGRGTDACSDAGPHDEAICEGTRPPRDNSRGCLPDGHPDSYVHGAERSAFVGRAGPRGPAVVIGDSLTAAVPIPIAERLSRIGFGPVCVDGVGSRTVAHAPFGHLGGLAAIDRLRAAHPVWSSDATWIVALGTNDSRAAPGTSVELAANEAGRALDAMGPAARDRWWINVRTLQDFAQAGEDNWNAGVASHSELSIIDWSSIARGRSRWFFDEIHLSDTGNRRRLNLIATALAPA